MLVRWYFVYSSSLLLLAAAVREEEHTPVTACCAQLLQYTNKFHPHLSALTLFYRKSLPHHHQQQQIDGDGSIWDDVSNNSNRWFRSLMAKKQRAFSQHVWYMIATGETQTSFIPIHLHSYLIIISSRWWWWWWCFCLRRRVRQQQPLLNVAHGNKTVALLSACTRY